MSDKKYDNDIVVSTRIRLARNIKDFCFPAKLSMQDALNINHLIMKSLTDEDAYGFRYLGMDDLSDYKRQSLVEKHIISPELGKYPLSGVVINRNENISVMINEEDHIRIQVIEPGFALKETYTTADQVDDIIQNDIVCAYSEKYGFITSCLTNLGTGLRAGVMLHLPALVLNSKLGIISAMANKYALAVRGIYGEGSLVLGDLFQISNQNSLGSTEDQIVDNLHAVTREIIKKERAERELIMIHNEDEIKDKVMRAYAILTHAHMISANEALKLLSLLRMGADLTLIDEVPADVLNRLMINIQPATLALKCGLGTDEKAIDLYRAKYIRQELDNK
jgi:protein arginine kinase